MAGFNPAIQPTRDPSYERNWSQGTDRASLQPLADVPSLSTKYVEPDYKVNRSGGTLLEGTGEVAKAGLTLSDNIIKQNIDDTLNKGIEKIRDSFGVAQASDLSSGVAAAVGKAGAEGVSLTAGEAKPLPAPIAKLGSKVDGLTESYNQGGLSNSMYYAKLEAYVRQIKQQFPGYSDEVDSMVSTKVGTTPANALRSALQQDVTELAKKTQAQNDKWTTYEHTNTQYIHTQWPNYEQLKAEGKTPSRLEVESVVGRLQARDYSVASKTSALALDKSSNEAIANKADEIATQRAGDIAGHLVVSIPNQLGIKGPSDFTVLLNDVRNGKRPPLTPDEKAAASGVLATMEQQYGIQFDAFINQKLSPSSPDTLASKSSPQRLQAIRAQGLSAINDLKAGLLDDKMGILASSANWNKATIEAGEGDFIRRAPVAVAVAAGRKFYGDQGIMDLVSHQPFLQSAVLEGFRQWNQGSIAQGGKSLRDTFDTFKREGINDGTLNRASITDTINTILHPEKTEDPKKAVENAVQHAFGPGNRTLLDAFDTKDQVNVFTQLVSPSMTKHMAKQDRKSRDTYFQWADESFQNVYQDAAHRANGTAESLKNGGGLNVKLTYDPGTANFSYVGATKWQSTAVPNVSLQGLNSGINSMKEVWKAQGKDATTELYRLLPVIGIEPGTAMYKAVQTEFMKAQPKENKEG